MLRLGMVLLSLSGTGVLSFCQQNFYRFSLETVDNHSILTLQTVEPLPCIGYSIRNSIQWEADTAVITISGFVRPTPCVQGFDAATARILLKLESKKTFYLRFREETYSDLWKVTAGEEAFNVSPIQNSFTSHSK